MYKDLVIPITATPGDSDAINVGITLAGAFEAHLTVLEMVNIPAPAGNPWAMPDIAMTDLYSRLRAQGEVNAARLRSRLEKEAISSDVRMVECLFSEPERMASHQAHYADLSIVAGSIGDTVEGAITQAYFGGLLLESGRPVLVVPPRCKTQLPPKRIVVAWRPTREAARTVHDALPFLRNADQVDVLVVNAAMGDMRHGQPPGADVATHLARHGVKANLVLRDTKTRPTSSILLEHARETHAQMIVAGGYGHSRLREWAMGGVTRELLIASPIPVFYSH
ncbi:MULTISPECIES: universal stress protein [unclassified Pseudoxanthomonas]|uniref:universal stress protein n=1 Tax=unclassified Pseudoxanthomonas TaxID=2645906 RepID=UPI0030782B96